MRTRPALLLFASVATAAVALTACGRTGFELDEDLGNIPRPYGFPDLGEIPVPTPTPRFGTGADGDVEVDGIGSVVNVCHVLVATSGLDGVVVGTAGSGAFKPLERVLLLQVQGRRSTSGDQTPITVLDSAGQWQVAEVVEAAGRSVRIAPGPTYGFRSDPSSRAQICRMPQYRNLIVNTDGFISASDWNGATGGVVAFFVSSTLTLADNSVIEATNDGFRGGPSAANGNTGGITALDPPQADGGRKGEGLDPQPSGRFGRGNTANGGGGGNGSDAGGGGGGNGGAGGIGGREFANRGGGNLDTRGFGGVPLVASLDSRLLFGGGAGAGHRNNGTDSTGGSGGGLVLVFARSLVGDGAIRADGRFGIGGGDDGGGGGGAGGTIRVEVESSTFTGAIDARGGRGASVGSRHGPGGGGGGGRIRLLGVSTAGLSSLDGSEGQSGTAAGDGPRGALNGLPGVVVTTP